MSSWGREDTREEGNDRGKKRRKRELEKRKKERRRRERQGGRKQIQRTRALFTSIYLML